MHFLKRENKILPCLKCSNEDLSQPSLFVAPHEIREVFWTSLWLVLESIIMFVESILNCMFCKTYRMWLAFLHIRGWNFTRIYKIFTLESLISRAWCFSIHLHEEGFPCSLNIYLLWPFITFLKLGREL